MVDIKKLGNEGEKLVANQLMCLPSDSFRLFNNVMFRTKNGTTQIDHLLVSTRGIFVIETKAHKGLIFGDAQSKYWTQCLFGKGKVINKFRFYSPYYQNRGHLKSVMYNLKTKSVCGLVCFTNDKVNLSRVNCESVYTINYLYQVVCNIFSSSPPADYNFNEMCNKVASLNIQSKYQDQKHIKYVNSLKRKG